MSKITTRELEALSEKIAEKANLGGYFSGKGDGEPTEFKTSVQNIIKEILQVV